MKKRIFAALLAAMLLVNLRIIPASAPVFDDVVWGYAVPLGFLAAAVLKLPPLWVYFLLCTDEFVKWPFVIRHYRSRRWLNNITRDDLFAPGPEKQEL